MNNRRSFLTGAVGSALLLGEASTTQAAPGRLPRAKPESLGIDPAGILGFVEAADKLGLHSLMLLRHGKVAAEGWWKPYGPQHPHVLYSLSKSFTSTAVGLAIAEGKIARESSVASFFPGERPAKIDDNLAAMQVRHLLMMGTGHDKDTTGAMLGTPGGDWVKNFLALPVEHAPGSKFVYNTGATYMLSAIVQKATGQTVLDYLRPRLFEPLGIEKPIWDTCPKGRSTGGFGLNIRTEDIAKFGQLYLQKGMWGGKRLLPAAWIDEASRKHIENGDPKMASDWTQGYGYQFWRCRHGMYRGDGAFGQFCIVLAEKDAVVALTSGTNDLQGVMNAVWEHLLPAYDRTPTPAPALSRRLKSLAIGSPQGAADSARAKSLVGKTFTFAANGQKVHSLQLTPTHLVVRMGDDDLKLGRGARGWTIGSAAVGTWEGAGLGSPLTKRVACRGAWPAPDTLEVTVCSYESPYIHTLTSQFTDSGEVTLTIKTNVGFGPATPIVLKGHG
jgi:CubicO group peptidase (beta-lactamase class C family)